MNRILVPTDFSPIADNALNYAIGIAAAFGSELYLYHVFTFDRFNYDLELPDEKQPYPKKLERRMKMTLRKFLQKIRQAKLTVHTKVEEASIYSLFGSKVNELGIDLIIMGSKGASGLEKIIFGTVASTALGRAIGPVLVVPPQHTFRPLKEIVLAIDDKEVSLEVLSPLHKLALNFGAQVTILNAKSGAGKKGYREVDHHLKGVRTTFLEIPMANSVNEAIADFVEKAGCDLLCMVRRNKGFVESFFRKSITRTQVYHNQVPLLVLPEKSRN